MANGNGSIARPAQATTVDEEEEENIFLFYPNLIGTYPPWRREASVCSQNQFKTPGTPIS
jgi:hypothetical protein